MSDDTVGIRIDPESKKKIQEKVKAKEYKNITAFVNEAIKEKLDNPDLHEMDKTERILVKILQDPSKRRDLGMP